MTGRLFTKIVPLRENWYCKTCYQWNVSILLESLVMENKILFWFEPVQMLLLINTYFWIPKRVIHKKIIAKKNSIFCIYWTELIVNSQLDFRLHKNSNRKFCIKYININKNQKCLRLVFWKKNIILVKMCY